MDKAQERRLAQQVSLQITGVISRAGRRRDDELEGLVSQRIAVHEDDQSRSHWQAVQTEGGPRESKARAQSNVG
ncbi:MAG: hypothetical protein JWP89_2878 [Schlesneria sp.]|nr:hypothetical protein [Schlesneria sp.]